ncbi:GNAT family N-acetyltransferase [soil metagenome]|jgi:GNAT superfamily N-acetyltransferase|nr:GNAT family N-acetyltransferase [Deinococcota bacterium]
MADVHFAVNDPDLDARAVNALYAAVGWNAVGQRTVEKTRQMLQMSACHVTARTGGELVGFGRILADPYTAQLLDLMIHPAFQRRGVASGILQRLLAFAEGKYLGVYLIDGSGLVGFYEHFGFEAANPVTDRLMYWSNL